MGQGQVLGLIEGSQACLSRQASLPKQTLAVETLDGICPLLAKLVAGATFPSVPLGSPARTSQCLPHCLTELASVL